MAVIAFNMTPSVSKADIGSHSSGAWRVIDVASHDRLNARMDPGATYPVIETFAANERLFATMAPGQSARAPYAADPNIDPVSQAQDLVRELYERHFQSENGDLPSAFDPSVAHNYFTDDIVNWLSSGDAGAHPLYGAQDFDGTFGEPTPDPHQPMLRGMITINVGFTNFGKKQHTAFYIRPDTTKSGAPLRIFRVEHDGWSYP